MRSTCQTPVKPGCISPLRLADGPKDSADAVEEQIVRGALADTHGNVTEAARRLGLVRENMYYYLKKYGIQLNRT